MSWVRKLMLAGLAVAVVGCGGTDESTAGGGGGGPPVACTEIGCTSGLFLDIRPVHRKLPAADRVRVCLRRSCHTYSLAKADVASFSVRGLHDGQRVSVRLVALDREGKVLLRSQTRAPVRKTQPNGPDCPPTCFQVAVRLDRQTLRLVPTET